MPLYMMTYQGVEVAYLCREQIINLMDSEQAITYSIKHGSCKCEGKCIESLNS